MNDLLQKIGLGAVIFIAGVIVTLIIIFIFRLKFGKTMKVVHKLDSVVLQQRLQDMGFIVTQEYMCTLLEDSDRNSELFGKTIPGTKKRVIFTCDITVCAGVHFEKINVAINKTNQCVKITLPTAAIYGEPALDFDSIHNVLDKKSVFAKRDGIDDYKEMFSDITDRAIENANKAGIITKANINAENLIKNFVYGILCSTEEFRDYEIEVQFISEAVIEN